MSTSVNLNEPGSLQDRTKTEAKSGTTAAIWLLIAVVGLGLVGGIYLSSLVHSADLPDLGQYFGP
jgi:hypothetical protein